MAIDIGNDILRDILVYSSRQALFVLSQVNRRFNDVISREFETAPCLVLDKICYNYNQWGWVTKHTGSYNLESESLVPIPIEILPEIFACKFLRFKFADFVLRSIGESRMRMLQRTMARICIPCRKSSKSLSLWRRSSNNPVEFLQSISHVWENADLRISLLGRNFQLTAEFADLVTTCKNFKFRADGSLSILAELLGGPCHRIKVIDNKYKPSMKLPITNIVNYLCRSTEVPHYLTLHTFNIPNSNECQSIVDAVMERFENDDVAPNVKLFWNWDTFDDDDLELVEREFDMRRGNRMLSFTVFEDGGLNLETIPVFRIE